MPINFDDGDAEDVVVDGAGAAVGRDDEYLANSADDDALQIGPWFLGDQKKK